MRSWLKLVNGLAVIGFVTRRQKWAERLRAARAELRAVIRIGNEMRQELSW